MLGQSVSGLTVQTCGAGAAADDNYDRNVNIGQSTCGSGIEEDEGDYKCGIKPQWLAVLWIFVIIVVVGIVVVVHGAKETCGRGGNTVRNVAQAPQAINVNVQMQPSAPPAHAPAAHMMQMPPAYAQPKGPVVNLLKALSMRRLPVGCTKLILVCVAVRRWRSRFRWRDKAREAAGRCRVLCLRVLRAWHLCRVP